MISLCYNNRITRSNPIQTRMKPRQLNIKRLKDLKAEFTKLTGREANAKSARSYLEEKGIDLGKLDFRKKVSWEKIILEIHLHSKISTQDKEGSIKFLDYTHSFENYSDDTLRLQLIKDLIDMFIYDDTAGDESLPTTDVRAWKDPKTHRMFNRTLNQIESCSRAELITRVTHSYKQKIDIHKVQGWTTTEIKQWLIMEDFSEQGLDAKLMWLELQVRVNAPHAKENLEHHKWYEKQIADCPF